MSKIRSGAKSCLTLVATAALVGTAAQVPAHADPVPSGFRTYAAVGSDTTQDVWNALTNGGPITATASYNAFPAGSTIKTKSNGATFNRPAGSSNGVRALSGTWDPANHNFQGVQLVKGEVDFARSSSGPAVAGTDLKYVPFARDAVTVVTKPFASGVTRRAFTTAQLRAIYGGADDNQGGTGVTYDAGTGLPVVSGRILKPVLPQAGSGTRGFFQSAINVPDGDLASYVPANSTLPENDGSALTEEGQVIPFSAAQIIAQKNGVSTNTLGTGAIASINGLSATTGTAPQLRPGSLFGTVDPTGAFDTVPAGGQGVFNRDTYNVIPASFLSPAATARQKALVSRLTGSTSVSLGSARATSIIRQYGFGVLSYYGDSAFYRDGGWLH